MMTMKKASRAKAKTAPKTKAKAAKKGPSQDEMMAMWAKAATPAENHKRLEPIVGTFRVRTTWVMAPSDEPSVSDATSEHRWVLGGRYVEQRYNGFSMGMPFEGIGYTGYDNVQKRYIGTWMDSFGTGLMNSAGIGKASAKEIRFASACLDPAGKKMEFESIVKIKDKNRHSYEMWTKAPNGKRYRTMLAEYTRA
jgi:hypothetical protein